MKIDARLLMAALEERRAILADLQGNEQPMNWVQVAAATGTYPMVFSRLKQGTIPTDENLSKIITWLNRDPAEFELCTTCPGDTITASVTGDTDLRIADRDRTWDTDDDGESDDMDTDSATASSDATPDKRMAVINGFGRLDVDSQDPETIANVGRVRELLESGAVAVSIGADMDPDKMPDKALLDELVAAEKWEEAEQLLAGVPFRLREVSVVNVAAMSDARMTVDEDGNISGPITFEGVWTGDMRFFPFESFNLESAMPISLLWDRENGGHDGMPVGTITRAERVEIDTVPQPDDAVSASMGVAGVDVIPAKYVAKPKPGPLTVMPPDENGLRHIFGTAAPTGVCHPNPKYSTQCFTYPGDADPQLKRFNSGMPRMLSDGTTMRLGALTMFGLHASTESMTRPGVTSTELARYEDGRTIFAAVRGYDSPDGMLIAGIVMPDITDAELQRALTMGASVEMAPTRLGRNVIGAHLVPTAAWPVAASGAAMTGPEPIVVAEPDPEPETGGVDVDTPIVASGGEELGQRLAAMEEALQQISTALALVVGKVLDFPEPADIED